MTKARNRVQSSEKTPVTKINKTELKRSSDDGRTLAKHP